MDRVQKIRMTVDRLGDLEDSQMATALLRSCLAFPKLNFALHTCPPARVRRPARVFDEAIQASIFDIVGGATTGTKQKEERQYLRERSLLGTECPSEANQMIPNICFRMS